MREKTSTIWHDRARLPLNGNSLRRHDWPLAGARLGDFGVGFDRKVALDLSARRVVLAPLIECEEWTCRPMLMNLFPWPFYPFSLRSRL